LYCRYLPVKPDKENEGVLLKDVRLSSKYVLDVPSCPTKDGSAEQVASAHERA